MPLIVEVGVLLDLFVGVFVMGIIIHHVNRQFSASTSDHLSALKE
jgi:hydrogenase-4 component E